MKSDYSSKEEVHNRALKIKDIRQSDLIKQLGLNIRGNKNAMGDVFEAWFGKTKDNSSEPDLGVSELKATPFKILKNKKNGKSQYSAKERLVLNIINYMDLVNENFESSHFLKKNKNLEIAYYEYNPDIPKDDWTFKYIILYQMMKSPTDFAIIKNDWLLIQKYVFEGRADQISESLTNYLAACTKGKNNKSVREQPFSDIPAKQRAFSFKSSFMTTMLRDNIIGNIRSDAIIKDSVELLDNSLTDIIIKRFRPFIGVSQAQLLKKFNIDSTAKSKNNMITRAILGLTPNHTLDNISEFNKASIIPKTIQFSQSGNNRESMSLPPFKFKELVTQSWCDSYGLPEADLNIYLHESKFLFVVFQKNKHGINILKGIKFYTMPLKEIDEQIKYAWEDTKNKLLDGVTLSFNGKRVTNNLIGIKNNMIVHIRPHSAKASYINSPFSNKLPTKAHWSNKPSEFSSYYMTTQSFWLNNDYIKNVVSDLLD